MKPIYDGPTLVELSEEQINNIFFYTAAAHIGHALLVEPSSFDKAIQILVPPSLCQRIFMVSNHSPLSKHPGKQHAYDTLRCNLSWPHITAVVVHIESTCSFCPRPKSKSRRRRGLQLSPASGPLNLSQWILWDYFPKQHKVASTYLSLLTDIASLLDLF